MISFRKGQRSRTFAGVITGSLLLLSFQNCGKAGFDSDLGSTTDYGVSDSTLSAKYGAAQAAKVEAVPFAYNVTFDTITYNSCSETHLRFKNQFSSLKVGAYASGGVNLTNDFYSYVDTNFNPIYPATELSSVQYKEILADSPVNKNVTANIAFRVKNRLTDILTTSNSVQEGSDLVYLVSQLSNPLVSESFINRTVARYFPFSPDAKNVEAAMNFNSSEALAKAYRESLNNGAVLALTYQPPNVAEVQQIVKPAGAGNAVAYGRGYALNFSAFVDPVDGGRASNPLRVINSVYEYDLRNQNSTGISWDCSLKYKVVRKEDRAAQCPAMTYARLSNAAVRAELAIAYRQLKSDEWDINVDRKCAVPIGNDSCYKEENLAAQGFAEVEYSTARECFSPTETYSNGTPTSKCQHFITVCRRPN